MTTIGNNLSINRFSRRAMVTLALAETNARKIRNDYFIKPEDILYSLIAEGKGDPAKILIAHGASLSKDKQDEIGQFGLSVGFLQQEEFSSNFTPPANAVFLRAYEIAKETGERASQMANESGSDIARNVIEPEHILAALITLNFQNQFDTDLLKQFGIDFKDYEAMIAQLSTELARNKIIKEWEATGLLETY